MKKKSVFRVNIRKNLFVKDDGLDYHSLTHVYDDNLPINLTMYRTMLYVLFDITRTRQYEVRTSIADIFRDCNFKLDKNYKRSSVYVNICNAIELLISEDYIKPLERPFRSYSVKEPFRIRLQEENGMWDMSLRYSEELGYEVFNEPYVSIYSDTFERIAAVGPGKLPVLLHTYLNMAALIPRRGKSSSAKEKPRCFYRSYASLASTTGLVKNTVINAVLDLAKAELIHYEPIGSNVGRRKPPNLYVLDDDNWEIELLFGREKLEPKYKTWLSEHYGQPDEPDGVTTTEQANVTSQQYDDSDIPF